MLVIAGQSGASLASLESGLAAPDSLQPLSHADLLRKSITLLSSSSPRGSLHRDDSEVLDAHSALRMAKSKTTASDDFGRIGEHPPWPPLGSDYNISMLSPHKLLLLLFKHDVEAEQFHPPSPLLHVLTLLAATACIIQSWQMEAEMSTFKDISANSRGDSLMNSSCGLSNQSNEYH